MSCKRCGSRLHNVESCQHKLSLVEQLTEAQERIKELENIISTAASRLKLADESEIGLISWDCICNALSWLGTAKD